MDWEHPAYSSADNHSPGRLMAGLEGKSEAVPLTNLEAHNPLTALIMAAQDSPLASFVPGLVYNWFDRNAGSC